MNSEAGGGVQMCRSHGLKGAFDLCWNNHMGFEWIVYLSESDAFISIFGGFKLK